MVSNVFSRKIAEKVWWVSVYVSFIISKKDPCKMFKVSYRTMLFPILKMT